MKAVLWTKYGGPEVLVPGDIPRPEPKEKEVLIKLHATTVSTGDCEMRSLNLPFLLRIPMRIFTGVLKPRRIRVLGQEFSGTVETVGKGVTSFKVGDEVFGTAGFGKGTYAEYICMPENPKEMEGAMALKPKNLSLPEAAAVPLGGLEALHFLRLADLQQREKILINGAGGSIGTFAVQLAKYNGALVTAVDSKEKSGMLLSIGAGEFIDYTDNDYTKGSAFYDVIFDVAGRRSIKKAISRLKKNGRYLLTNPKGFQLFMTKNRTDKEGRKVIKGPSDHTVEDLLYLNKLIESGAIKPVIDRTYSLEDTAEAHRYVESGAKQGNVIVIVSQNN